jgi:hypothetical protein
MATLGDKLVDKRIVERNIAKGLISKQDYEQHLTDLQDRRLAGRLASGVVSMSEEDSAPPSIDFNTFVLSLSTSALMHLGTLPGAEDDLTVNLAHAKQSIDCIALLEEKTRGNLTGEEERLITEVLYDLRLRFVAARKAADS